MSNKDGTEIANFGGVRIAYFISSKMSLSDALFYGRKEKMLPIISVSHDNCEVLSNKREICVTWYQ